MGNLGIGAISLMLLIGVSFTMYLGGYPSGFVTLFESLQGNPIDLANLILANLGGIALTGGLTVAAALFTRDSTSLQFVITATILSTTVYILFMPLAIFRAADIPADIQMFIYVFFNVLILITIISFVSGRDF